MTDTELDKLVSETRKLDAEANKLMAEERKRAAEELHLLRQRMIAPWHTILLAIAAGAGLYAMILRLIEAKP